jgi:hypothetical protein
MFGRKPRWLRHGYHLINLGRVDYFETSGKDINAVNVFFKGTATLCVLHGITLADIHYFLKKGRPRRGKPEKSL